VLCLAATVFAGLLLSSGRMLAGIAVALVTVALIVAVSAFGGSAGEESSKCGHNC
jgi:hypothetical protein